MITSRRSTMVECTNLHTYSVEKHELKSVIMAISIKSGQLANTDLNGADRLLSDFGKLRYNERMNSLPENQVRDILGRVVGLTSEWGWRTMWHREKI